MKHIFLLFFIITMVSCKEEPKDYVTFTGTITNQNSDSLMILDRTGYTKVIHLENDGTFSDTLKVKTGSYSLFDGNEYATIHLKNGSEINMTVDTKEFDETISFTGTGSETSNFFAKYGLFQEEVFTPELYDLEEEAFNSRTKEIANKFNSFLNNYPNIDSTTLAHQRKSAETLEEQLKGQYKRMQARVKQFEPFIGKPSPTFVNFENHKGGTTSLSDLKGKYVYVDVWATWCGPCKYEIPFLKEIEKEYHNKNIEFVSISLDNGRGYKGNDKALAKQGWKDMVTEKELSGIQLLADKDWQSDFVRGYKIKGIPRFILIDPNGNVVNADAPRPSSPKLKKLFNSLEDI